MIEWLSYLLILASMAFFCAGSIGLIRLPDLRSRLHALTKADNVALGLLVAGFALLQGSLLTAAKLFLIWLLVMLAGSASAYLIAEQPPLKEETND